MLKKIGLIGDVHARDDRLAAALEVLTDLDLDAILCTGDIMDGPGCPDRCIDLLKAHGVSTVRGNHDRWVMQGKARHVPNAHHPEDLTEVSLNYLEHLPTQLEFETTLGTLLLCHGVAQNDLRKVWPGTERMPAERSSELDALIANGRHQFVINGHMHFKIMIHFEQLTLINAGTISGDLWPGFTTIDFDRGEVQAYRFEDEKITACKLSSLTSDGAHQVFRNTACFEGDWEPKLLFEREPH